MAKYLKCIYYPRIYMQDNHLSLSWVRRFPKACFEN